MLSMSAPGRLGLLAKPGREKATGFIANLSKANTRQVNGKSWTRGSFRTRLLFLA
jgi:hypothetical protein